MNDPGSKIPTGGTPRVGCPRAPGRRPEIRALPPAFLWGTRRGMACGDFAVTLQLEHEDLRFPLGKRRHVLNVRCVVEALAASAVPVSLRFPNLS